MPGIAASHLADAHVSGMHHNNNAHSGKKGYRKGPQAHGVHKHYMHGAHGHSDEHRLHHGPHGAHRQWHADKHRTASAHGMDPKHPGEHHRASQHPGQKGPGQLGMAHKLCAGAHHPAVLTAGLEGKPPVAHPDDASASEPRAFDDDEFFTRDFDEELLARSLADELIARKVNVGKIFDDMLTAFRREDEELLAREDEEDFVARDVFFDELD